MKVLNIFCSAWFSKAECREEEILRHYQRKIALYGVKQAKKTLFKALAKGRLNSTPLEQKGEEGSLSTGVSWRKVLKDIGGQIGSCDEADCAC